MSICICKYPILLIDSRDGKDVTYLSMPVEIIVDGYFDTIPDMEVVETESLTGITGYYMKVTWKEPPFTAKKYDVRGHIVVAGCPEEALQCDSKNIYVCYHPLEEWIDGHIVELK